MRLLSVEKAREVFEACRESDVPIDVVCVAGSAADNAAATIEENGGVFVRGEFGDDFIWFWYLTVMGILSESDCSEEARAWFGAAGLDY